MDLTARVVILILLVTGLAALAAGPIMYGLLLLLNGRDDPGFSFVAAAMSATAVVLNAGLQLYGSRCWNRRAAKLRAAVSDEAEQRRPYDEYE